MNPSAKVHPGVELFISGFNHDMQERLWYLRELIMSLPYQIEERPVHGFPYYANQGFFAGIFVRQKKHTELLFPNGALLPDTAKLLTGTGNLLRFLRVTSIEQYPEEVLLQALHEAAEFNIQKKIRLEEARKLRAAAVKPNKAT